MLEISMKESIRRMALESGYILAGFSPVELGEDDRRNLREYEKNLGEEMSWFHNHSDIRMHPEKLQQGAKSVLVLASPYRNENYESFLKDSEFKISLYAAGSDYHGILRKRGKKLLSKIAHVYPEIQGRITVDSAPVPEKIFGAYSGIGFRGKHTNLIHPEFGSYFFLSAIFLNVRVEPDSPMNDRCGSCRKCVDACPTSALSEYRIDAKKCISYLTIEKKGLIPEDYRGKMNGWIFGCDICQEVCPYNLRARSKKEPCDESFLPRPQIVELLKALKSEEKSGEDVLDRNSARDLLRNIIVEDLTRSTPLRRAGLEKILDNIEFAGRDA